MSPAVTQTYPVHSSLHLRNIPDYKCSCKILRYWCRTYSFCSCVYLRRTHQCLKKTGHQIAATFKNIRLTYLNLRLSRTHKRPRRCSDAQGKLKLKHISLSKNIAKKEMCERLLLDFRFFFAWSLTI